MICLSRLYHIKSFKGCLPQISIVPFLNTLSHVHSVKLNFSSTELTFMRDDLLYDRCTSSAIKKRIQKLSAGCWLSKEKKLNQMKINSKLHSATQGCYYRTPFNATSVYVLSVPSQSTHCKLFHYGEIYLKNLI